MATFVLEVDLETGAMTENPQKELARILRYWAGAMKDCSLEPGSRQELSDSGYTVVGAWQVRA